MKKYIFSVIALAASLVGCTGDYTDWASPIKNDQPATITFGDGSVTEVGLINFADAAVASSENVQVCTIVAPTASDASYSATSYKLNLKKSDTETSSMDISADGKIATAALKEYVETVYGKAPEERTITANVEQWISNGSTVVKTATSADFSIKVKLNAPVIYPHLYLIGGVDNNWDPTSTIRPFTHSGKDVYEDPVFTITVPVEEGETWFAITDDKTVQSGSWDDVWSPKEGNGNNKIGEKGNIGRRGEYEGGNNCSFKISVAGDAKYMKITVNMLDGTYKIDKINYSPYIYFIGSTDGWTASDQKLETINSDGVYTGYIYVADPNNWGLAGKFQRVAGSWDDEINATTFTGGMRGVEGSNNLEFLAEGVYYITVDLVQNTIDAVQITNMNLVGDFNGWSEKDDAQQMTWNASELCYEITGAGVTANGWKFTANNGWGINLGGDVTNLFKDGANLTVVGSTIKLYPCRTKSNNIYCTVE